MFSKRFNEGKPLVKSSLKNRFYPEESKKLTETVYKLLISRMGGKSEA